MKESLIPKLGLKEIIYIGDKFYSESNTLMSSIYTKEEDGSYKRYDWGKLQCDVKDHTKFYAIFRKPTDDELKYFENKLNETLVKWGKQKGMKANVYDASCMEDVKKAIEDEFGFDVYIIGG